MQPNNSGAEPKLPWYGCVVMLIFAAIIIAVLWFVGNWIWDFVGGLFDGGDHSRLARYCAGKWGSSPLYRECVNDGWKPWYSTASWMK